MKKISILSLYVAGIMFILSASPIVTEAKDKGNGKQKNEDKKEQRIEKKEEKNENKKNDDQNKKSNKNCPKAFGHLIAFGWLKKNSAQNIPENCRLPYGIWKKIYGNATTTPTPTPTPTTTPTPTPTPTVTPTPDTLAPVISNIVGNVGTTSATISWTTNESATSKVYFSLNTPVNLSSASFVLNPSYMTSHSIIVPNLFASTTYYFVIESKDTSNNTATSSQFSLKTLASTTPDTTGPVISNIQTNVSSTSIQVSWITNEPASSKVFFVASSTIDTSTSTTPFVYDGTLVLSHAMTIPSLSTSTLYSLVIGSKDASDNITESAKISTTTLAN